MLQEAFFYLALTNTRRVARLCSSPDGLACWALEILKDAAEGALKFVQDYDTSALGLGQVLEASGSHDQVIEASVLVFWMSASSWLTREGSCVFLWT